METEKEKENETAEKEKEIETAEKWLSQVEELPKTIVRRLVKNKLSQLSSECDISVLRDSLQAFSESARVFIHYLSATANDICKESNRQIITAEDVFKALEDIEFTEFIAPLRASLEEFRQKNGGRKSGSSKAKDGNKKAKKNEQSAHNGDGSKQQEDDKNDGANSSD